MRASFLRVMGKEKRGRESTDERAANEGDALRESQLGCLPKHIFADVVSRLDGADVARLGATCRAARALCSRPSIWRALARAQEPPALVREDLVNRDFTWKQLYAWRRHVLAHRARGVNRIAVADSARVLTCDPVEGGGRIMVAHEAASPQPLHPNLLTWSPGGEMLAVAQESAEGCRLILSAPPVALRPARRRNQIVNQRIEETAPHGGMSSMGDDDSTAAAGHGLIAAHRGDRRTDRTTRLNDDESSIDQDDDSTDDDGSVDFLASHNLRLLHGPPRVRTHKRPAMNSVHLPLQNPIFASFGACGTRLLLMNARRQGEEFALHELDLAVAVASLYGAPPGAGVSIDTQAQGRNTQGRGTKRPRLAESTRGENDTAVRGVGPGGWLSADAKETLTLVQSGRELSFSHGPHTRDVVSVVDGAGVTRIAPVVRTWSGLNDSSTCPVVGGRASANLMAQAFKTVVSDHEAFERSFHHSSERLISYVEGLESDDTFDVHDALEEARRAFKTRDVSDQVPTTDSIHSRHPAWRIGGDGVPGAHGGDPLSDNRLDEVSSNPESLWWRRSVDLARGGYVAGIETLRNAATWAARSLLWSLIDTEGAGDASGGRRRRRRSERERAVARRTAEMERRSRTGERAIKRARLRDVVPTRGAVGSRLGKLKKGSGDFQNPFVGVIPASRRAQPSHAVGFREDKLHEASLPGLAHIVQWVKPARGAEGVPSDDHGHWLVPVSFPDAMPRAVHLALVPAHSTPGPEEVRGTDAERAEAARLALLGLSDPSRRDVAARVADAVQRSTTRAKESFKASSTLEDQIIVELAPPAVYNELHAVVPTVAAAAPGGRFVCWADDGAMWSRRSVNGPDGVRTWDRAVRVLDLRRCGFGADAGLEIEEGSVAPNPVLHQVQAMQWSASGRRLLVLMACHFTTASHVFPMHQWMVWDPPATWLEDNGGGDSSSEEDEEKDGEEEMNSDEMGGITRGRWHVPSKVFVQDCLPIFEQYSQTHSLWNPDEDCVCYPVSGGVFGAAATADGGDQIEMARFPRLTAKCRREGHARDVRQVGEHMALPFVHTTALQAVVVCEGSFCVWSPC
jgi:hypothetical protein